MPNTAGTYPFLKNIIESWPGRIKKVGLTQKQVAFAAGLSQTQFSQIVNGHVDDPRMLTIDAVERVISFREGEGYFILGGADDLRKKEGAENQESSNNRLPQNQ